MPSTSDVITFSDAAEQKECSRTTLYRACDDGRLTDVKVGDRRMIVMNEQWVSFEPKTVGARAQERAENEATA